MLIFLVIALSVPLFIVLLNLLLRWLVAPIIVRLKYRMAANPSFEPTRAEELTPEVRDFLGTILPQFFREGFEAVANISLKGMISGVNGAQIVLVNRATSDIAIVITSQGTLVRSLVFAIRSHFADGK